ncbi:MAG: hypothetical protein V4632_17365 [Pseudomonadota bacterium]
MKRLILISSAALLLAACSEKPQVMSSAYNKADGKPWQGAQNPHVVKGWTPGDKTTWETQLRTRSKYQDEYVKVN